MSETHRIIIETRKLGRGTETLTKDCCPFKKGGAICTLENIECKYGLTEVRVPFPVCPLGSGVEMTISIEINGKKRKAAAAESGGGQ